MEITGEQFGDIQILRYELKGFEQLTLRQKTFVYYLAKTTLAGRDITTDQFGKYNLHIRKLMETVYLYNRSMQLNTPDDAALELYLKQIWFANGIYHHYSSLKFAPSFSPEYLRERIQQTEEALLMLLPYNSVQELCNTLFPIIFDANVLPKRVNKSADGDMLLSSACNYYENVTQQEAEAFYDALRIPGEKHPVSYGLNSKLVKRDGVLQEEVWNLAGQYGPAIRQILHWLEKAQPLAETEQQRKAIQELMDYYVSGSLQMFDQYSVTWVSDKQSTVDFINGFIEVYGDPLGLKGSWEGIVHYIDAEATRRTDLICQNAQWFEDHSPVAEPFRKKKVKGVSARVVCAAMLGGDEYPSTAIGINLPNSDWIRVEHGSKSITIGNLTHAYAQAARGNGFMEEFVIDPSTLQMVRLYDDVCDDLHTDLHECVGHGSGQLLPGVESDALKNYADTIEEARADLFALYYLADEKLVQLGLTPSPEAYQAQYYTYIMNGALTQLVRLKRGEQLEEAHMRNRALIARWTLAHAEGAAELVKREGKTFLQVNNYAQLRTLFGRLLSEVQRIKSEGDFKAAQTLVETYGVQVDGALHEEMLERYNRLGIKPFKGFLNPKLVPIVNSEGEIVEIQPDYTETYTEQMLRYSREYGTL